jgi:hypothetical protein
MYRVLKKHGRLILSDPVCEMEIPEHLRNDERLRALCLSSAIPLSDYVDRLTSIGFGTIEIRAKRPYRVLDPNHYNTDKVIFIESVEICAIKDPMPKDGPCVFTGKTKTADALNDLRRDDIYISESTYFYDGGGCC